MFSPEIISRPKTSGILNKLAYAHANKAGIRDFCTVYVAVLTFNLANFSAL